MVTSVMDGTTVKLAKPERKTVTKRWLKPVKSISPALLCALQNLVLLHPIRNTEILPDLRNEGCIYIHVMWVFCYCLFCFLFRFHINGLGCLRETRRYEIDRERERGKK